ncbi:MAG: M23 family metallopeptidase [Tannerella sp.]|jgi:murein DD-endopeptidase MepM/ murein hydrolase activator NlpD|nr:M23 family metallopeptidase [Tannerella sp.]
MKYKLLCLTLFMGLCRFSAEAQELRNPFDFPALLSGGFGELRANHFHSGIDFKTQGVEGKAVHAVQNGYICRIVVSPWGYGNALYLMHPDDSTVTVYGHLQHFEKEVAAYVKAQQYERESFSVDLSLTPEQFPFKKGDIIAYSGNTGGSGGPHLHFEIRDALTEEPLDPLPCYKDIINDSRPPKVRAVMIYPSEGQGVVNGSKQKQVLQLTTGKDGKQSVSGKVEAWGKVAFSINIDDYMDGTTNVYGVRELSMSVDDQLLFHSFLDRFSFDETRYINAWVDYETWQEKHSFYTKTFVEPGNHLRFISSRNRGYLTIDEPRTYHVLFQLTDTYGNTSKLPVEVKGKEQTIAAPDTAGTTLFSWNRENRFGAKGVRLSIPYGCLYKSVNFRYTAKKDTAGIYLSDIHILHNKPVPLHKPAKLSLYLVNDTLAEERQYGVVSLQNKRRTWIGGTYRERWIDANIKELGSYTVMVDTVAPKINPIEPAQWVTKKKIEFRLTDNLSGVSSYRGEIDGNYALFEMDGKKALISYAFDPDRLSRGKHTLTMTVTDDCGNRSVYENDFSW